MLTAQNISYQIGKQTLLDNVSVTFLPQQLNLIIGANGAGKSTLVKILANQLRPSKGEVSINNAPLATQNLQALARIRAVLSQNIDLAFPLSVAEVVMMGRYPHFSHTPAEKDNVACEEAMRFFGVWEMAQRNYMTLSGGEKQRVHFARVFAQIWYPAERGCNYLIVDEPLTFLDIYHQYDFMTKVVALLQRMNLVMVGIIHDLNLAAKFADTITLLHKGKVLATGTPKEVLTTMNIKEAYQMEATIKEENGKLHLFF